MALQDILDPNQNSYTARAGGRYIANRLVTHNGQTIAIALGKGEKGALFFEYSILNSAADAERAKAETQPSKSSEAPGPSPSTAETEKLDSQCWFENAKTLIFPSEVRVVGEDAVPVYEIPAIDSNGDKVGADRLERRDVWKSTSLCLMEQTIKSFEVLSDGKYIYLFRQGAAVTPTTSWPNALMKAEEAGVPPVDGNLLCDRFMLVGSSLNQTLEARYRRSRQKRIPLNDQDTLGVRDINDKFFYEPTHSLRFVPDLVDGRFSVLRAPTVTNDIFRWVFFSYSSRSRQIEYLTTDVASDGLFDLHGQVYYTCDSTTHPDSRVFATAPGSCTAIDTSGKRTGEACSKPRIPLVSKGPLAQHSLSTTAGVSLCLDKPIDLSDARFKDGFVLEAWIRPKSFWENPVSSGAQKSEDESKRNQTEQSKSEGPVSLPPAGSLFSVFPQSQAGGVQVLLNDQLQLLLCKADSTDAFAKSHISLKADAWAHVAVTYSGPATRRYMIVVDGTTAESAAFTLPQELIPGVLETMAAQKNKPERQFVGSLDEVRLWNREFHPSTIKERMYKRVTGMEQFLEACWHFDEGAGVTAYDASSNHHSLTITPQEGKTLPSDVWDASAAQLVASQGLSRRLIRLPSNIEVCGGLGSTLYNEQVTVSKPASESKPGSEPPKQMKRSTRVLLSFVARNKKADLSSRLAVVDFALLSDGMLCDTPAELPLPNLTVVQGSPTSSTKISTALIHIDPQGMEVFGGLLTLEAVQCGSEAPCAFESATGTVALYFRGSSGNFSALNYDISRSILLNSESVLSAHEGLYAKCKLRQAKSVTVKTELCPEAPKEVAINLKLIANMSDGSKVTETWRCVPSRVDKFCALVSGTGAKQVPAYLGNCLDPASLDTKSNFNDMPCTEINLDKPLKSDVPAGANLMVGGVRRYLVLQDAKVGTSRLVGSLCHNAKPNTTPTKMVLLMGYDHATFVTCQGKAAGNFAQGSSVAELILPKSRLQSTEPLGLIGAPLESSITGDAQSPSFASAPISTALRLQGGQVCSMLTEVPTTAPCAGLSFESWIKIDQATEDSVLVAYKSTHSRRSERSPEETQTFVLGASTTGNDKVKLVGKANGSIFSVGHEQPTVPLKKWTHFACSSRNAFAIRFSGGEHVDLGSAAEFNVSDFSLAFTMQLDKVGQESQTLFIKSDSWGKSHPLHVSIEDYGRLHLRYWAEDEDGGTSSLRTFYSGEKFEVGVPYKVFISRKLAHVPKKDQAPRPYQLVTMRAWRADGYQHLAATPASISTLTENEKSSLSPKAITGPHQTHGPSQGNEAPLYVGGSPSASFPGFTGIIGGIALYSAAIATPKTGAELSATSASEKSLIGWWSCRTINDFTLIDDLDRNNGKLKGSLIWLQSPYAPDHQLNVFINGVRSNIERPAPEKVMAALREPPAGRHQLTLGNVLLGDDSTRFMGSAQNFTGELDELRIWSVPRTRENICDSIHTRLTQVPPEIAIYLPFDDPSSETKLPVALQGSDDSITLLTDASINCWRLTPIYDVQTCQVKSEAPVGHDAPCVRHILSSSVTTTAQLDTGASPSISEYGDMQISASGGMEGAYKRAYTYIDTQGRWCLVTGFRIGTLLTEWVGQVQTAPTLIGYIEGAPPLPVDSFTQQNHRPSTSVRFQQAKKCTYSYSSRKEGILDVDLSVSKSMGAKWEVSTGMGVETELTHGEIKAGYKTVADISHGYVQNEVTTSTTNTNMDMRVELTGAWVPDDDAPVRTDGREPDEKFQPTNTGLALVESEVADVFALRLQMRGPVAPLVAYQMRPNPDIPKDRNLVSFEINRSYTKQGCLDGRRGTKSDVDYAPSSQAPKDASYFKPIEAYALKDRIKRAEEQRQGEYDQHSIYSQTLGLKHPKRVSRNICNSYVWTADGGTYQETHSTLDVVQAEVGGSLNTGMKLGLSSDSEVAAGGASVSVNVDAMFGVHFNLNMTKEKTTDEGFDLDCDLPPPVDIREYDAVSKRLNKKPGAVDCYRWMSFWLEPSVEATEVFFQQVLDPVWLEQSPEPNANLLRELRTSLASQVGDARTKAWRVLHRCTYVSRVPEAVAQRPAAATVGDSGVKKSTLHADVACNWLMLQKLEPWARGVQNRAQLALRIKDRVTKLYPALVAQPLFYAQVLDLLGDYLGLL